MCSDYPLSPNPLQNLKKSRSKPHSRCVHEGPDPKAGTSLKYQVHTLLQINFSGARKVHYDFFIMKHKCLNVGTPREDWHPFSGRPGLPASRSNCPRRPQSGLSSRPMADSSHPDIPPSSVMLSNRNGRLEPAANGNWGRRSSRGASWASAPLPGSRGRRAAAHSRGPLQRVSSNSRQPQWAASRYSSPRAALVDRARGSGG